MKNEVNNNSEINKSVENNPNKSNSRAVFVTVIIVLVILLGIAASLFITNKTENEEQLATIEERNMELQSVVAERDSAINDLVSTFNEIEKDLSSMREKENILAVQSDNPEFTNDMRIRILDDIKQLNTLLEDNKQKVSSLNKRLKKSGIQIAALEDKIGLLQQSIADQDSSMNVLKLQLVDRDFQMAELNLVVDSLNMEMNKKEEVITEKDAELNKAFLASGSYEELEQKGVLEKEGGFLGLGKSKSVAANLPEKSFDKINIKDMDKIAVNAKKATIISEHPENSYSIVGNDSIVSYIAINNPDEFWRITKYAVVETGK